MCASASFFSQKLKHSRKVKLLGIIMGQHGILQSSFPNEKWIKVAFGSVSDSRVPTVWPNRSLGSVRQCVWWGGGVSVGGRRLSCNCKRWHHNNPSVYGTKCQLNWCQINEEFLQQSQSESDAKMTPGLWNKNMIHNAKCALEPWFSTGLASSPTFILVNLMFNPSQIIPQNKTPDCAFLHWKKRKI